MSEFINPMDKLASTSNAEMKDTGDGEAIESTSLVMDEPNVCGKCKSKMSIAKLANDTPAYWCGKCRVSGPVEAE